jgi:hypothetical protein
MSHTISYKHVAIQFPLEALTGALPDARLYQDQFILLELHGDNNLTTIHPYTNREVGSRNWTVQAFGHSVDIVRNAVQASAFCEGYDLRLYGQRQTMPESYIRRVRNTLKQPYSANAMSRMGFELIVELDENHVKDYAWAAQLLDLQLESTQKDGRKCWRLRPLQSEKEAALLFSFRFLDSRFPWNIMSTEGPRFEQEAPELFRSIMAA